MEEKPRTVEKLQVNPGYAMGQIATSLATSEQHEDPASRDRARERLAKWLAVWNGLISGAVDVGSRTPIAGTPGWVTLEVVTSGFAPGEFLAGGPFQQHERELLARLSLPEESRSRQALNAYYLTDAA